MDHAEVLDRLEAAMVGPGKLAVIESDDSVDGIELRRHLEGCEDCASEHRAWWTAAHALAEATPDSLRAPAEARARILAAVTASPRPASAVSVEPSGAGARPPAAVDSPSRAGSIQQRSRAPSPTWIALAAAAAAFIFVLGAFLGGPLGLAPTTPPATERPAIPLAVATAVDRILRQPDHRQVTLVGPSGETAGSLLFDPASRELVVLTDRLPQAASGTGYDCFLERSGDRTRVGSMGTSNGFSFWAGPMDDPADAGLPGDRFVVVEDGSSGPPALAGDL